MKTLFLLLFPALAFAQQSATTFTGNLGTAGQCGRPDATLCVQAPTSQSQDQLHSNFTIDLALNPCNPLAEGMVNFQGRNSGADNVQMGSVSVMWSGGCNYPNGYSVLRLNATQGGGGQADMAYRQWGGRGIGLFRASDNDTCGGRFLCITRTLGLPSVAGKENLVLEGCQSGNCDLFLNSYSTGRVRIALGGGQVQIGTPTTMACPNGWAECMPMLDRNLNTFYVQVGR